MFRHDYDFVKICLAIALNCCRKLKFKLKLNFLFKNLVKFR